MMPASASNSTASTLHASGTSALLAQHQRSAVLALLVTLSVCAPIVTLGLYLREGTSPLFWTATSLSLCVWSAHVIFLLRWERQAISILVAAVVAMSIVAIVLQGTVRSAAVLVLIAAVIASGTLLATRVLILTAAVCIIALAILNIAEQMGWLRKSNLEAGLAVWLTQSAVLITVLVSVYYGRRRLTDALEESEKALEKSHRIETQLRMSERWFVALFQNNPSAAMVQRYPTREVLDLNAAYESTFRTHRENLIGQRPQMLWKNRQDREKFIHQLDTQGRVQGLRTTGLRADGTSFDALVSSELLTEGNVRLMLTVTVDISEQESAWRALELSEQRFSKAFNRSPLGMTITQLSNGRILEANAANEQVLGYRPADCVGTTVAETPIWLSDQDRKQFTETLLNEGSLGRYDTRLRHRTGNAVDVRIWSELIEIEGKPSVLSFMTNVTEEKRREAVLINLATGVSGQTGLPFFQSLVKHMALAFEADLVVVGEMPVPGSVKTVAVHFEGQSVSNFAYQVEGTPCGHAVAHEGDCFYSDKLATHYPADRFPIGGGYDTYLGVALHDADGQPIGILKALWVTPKANTNEMQALMRIFASRCNSELVRLQRDREIQKLSETLELRVAERTSQLEYLNRELDSFSYTVSHDLKSPLRSIDGFMHVLQEQMADRIRAEDREVIGRVNGAVARMGHLIGDLLALARVSQNTLGRRPVDLSAMATDVLIVEGQRDPGRTVDIHVEPGLQAHCDPHMCRIVLENLLGNAWKYSRHQPRPRIDFGLLRQSENETPAFYVRDNGAGFDMSRSDRLFKPFNRLHSANQFEGSGIGLATVRRIIERHGGHIRGEGVVGLGATFEFSLGTSVD